LEILVSEIPQRKKKPGARELSTVVKAAHQWASTFLRSDPLSFLRSGPG